MIMQIDDITFTFGIASVVFMVIFCLSVCMKAVTHTPISSTRGVDKSSGLLKEEKEGSNIVNSDEKVLSPSQFRPFKLIQIVDISHNTKLFRFEIPDDRTIGLGIGRHISVRADIGGNSVIRAYTPTSMPDQKGYFELLIKTYELGKLSPYLHSLPVGASIDVRGPVGRFKYAVNSYSKMGLIAGGTGLTPCLQVIRSILENSNNEFGDDTTSFVLLYQNRKEEDILLKDTIESLVSAHPSRLQVVYFLSNPSTISFGEAANERRGYISLDVLYEHMNINSCPFVGVCGPSGFNDCIKGLLKKVGHASDESVYIW